MEALRLVLLGMKELCCVKRELINIYGMKKKVFIMTMTQLNMNNQYTNLLPLTGHFGLVVPVKNKLKSWCMYANIEYFYNYLVHDKICLLNFFIIFFNNYRKISLPKFEVLGGLVSGTEESRGTIALDRPNRQWDYPFGWAPHQIMAWRGLENYGF